jgi:tripartite-type tricarboxylate transporter receptor subunit TctC
MNMTRRQLIAAGGLALLGRNAWADDYPARTINYIVPYAPGGVSDTIARLFADGVQRNFGKNVIVDYKPGAGGAIGAEMLTRAAPDGYTVMGATNAFYSVMPFLNKLKYEPMQDLLPVGMTGDVFMAIVVSGELPVKNLRELIAYAKANPGKLSYGSSGIGTVGHLCGEYLKKRTGTHIVHIPYRGAPAALQACMANEVQIVFGGEGAEAVLAGKLKGLAILGSQRWPRLPGVPTTDEAGLSKWPLRSWHTITVPGKTPPAIAKRLNEIVNQVMGEPAVIAKLQQIGVQPAPLSLAELMDRAKADQLAFGQLIKDARIEGAA